MPSRTLPLPPWYEPEDAGRWSYDPALETLRDFAERWRREHGIRPAHEDEQRVGLVLIDMQKDFCLPEGTLFVGGRSGRGAIEDSDRIARWIYRHLDRITEIVCTLDTHGPHAIFSPSFWRGPDGERPAPFTTIEFEDVRSGRWRPDPAVAGAVGAPDGEWLARHALHYTRTLRERGRDPLTIWPAHVLLGTAGHTLTGVIAAARLVHAWSRAASDPLWCKGEHPLTESYSALRPEVETDPDGRRLAGAARDRIEHLLSFDRLFVAGEAASHCVRATVEDLVAAARERGPDAVARIHLLRDGMSAVAVPDAAGGFVLDHTARAERALARFAELGVCVTDTTAALASR